MNLRTNREDQRELTKRGARGVAAIVSSGLILLTVGCSELVTVPSSPHEIDFNDPITLDGLMIGTLADFTYAYDAWMADQARFADIFFAPSFDSGHLSRARRDVTEFSDRAEARDQTPYVGIYGPEQRAHFTATNAQEVLQEGQFPEIGEPFQDSDAFARAALYEAYVKIWIADKWCSAAFLGQAPEYSSLEVYGLAEEVFGRVLAASGASPQTRQAALVGRARARLNQGDLSGVVSDAAQVEPGFRWELEYSTNSFEQRNRVWWQNWGFANSSVDFRRWAHLTVDDTDVPDPRVSLTEEPTDAYDPAWPLWGANKVRDPSSPLTVASYEEARLMIAEAELGQTAVEEINHVREMRGIDIEWSPDSVSDEDILNKVIDERGRTLFLEGVRMGDLRRYQRAYEINLWQDTSVQGEPMEEIYCYPLPNTERENNPHI